MKAHIKLPKGTFEISGETQKDLFLAWTQTIEVFGEKCCGLCGCEDISPVTRIVKKRKVYTYFEWHCQNPNCKARLSISQNLEGGSLYPVRRLEPNGKPATIESTEGKWGNHNGWTKYKGDVAEEKE